MFLESCISKTTLNFYEILELSCICTTLLIGLPPPKPELKDLMHLQVSDWSRLGLALKLDPYELDIIKKDHPSDTKSQTCKMFELWLRKQPYASYEQLIKALHEVGDETVANSLCSK